MVSEKTRIMVFIPNLREVQEGEVITHDMGILEVMATLNMDMVQNMVQIIGTAMGPI